MPSMNSAITLQLPITGMTCASCVARVERAIKRVPGVQEASVNGATEQARLVVDGSNASATAQAVAVGQAGYGIPEASRRLRTDGMTCASCVGRIEKALDSVPGVLQASVNLATATTEVRHLAGSAADADLLAAVQRAGYQPAPIAQDAAAG